MNNDAVYLDNVLGQVMPTITRAARQLARSWFYRNRLDVVEDIVSLTCVLILQDRLASRQSGTTTQQYAYKMVLKAASQVADRKHSRLVTRLKRRPRAQPMAEIPVEALERLQTQEEVWEAINELRDNLRIPLIMRFFDGMNSEEIGRDLGVTTNAIDLRLWQGKRKLRSRLKPPG